MQHLTDDQKHQQGFTLIEMSIVLLIMGLILSGLLVALSQNQEGNRRTNAQTEVKRIEEALYGFAQTYGRLPCPARHDSAGAEAADASDVCTSNHGFVPIATLGLSGSTNPDGLLTDPWGNPYRYSVAQLMAGGNRAFTTTTGLSAVFADPTLIPDPTMLTVCSDISDCAGTALANQIVPAVILSMGANWATFSSDDEIANGGPVGSVLGTYRVSNNNNFVSTTYRGETYDDIILWLSPSVLFSRMISAGALP
jgi:prepilin-type N-terminal cleavage/methylation domain-containing protein